MRISLEYGNYGWQVTKHREDQPDLIADRLTWDEMLGQVAMMTMPQYKDPGGELYRMKTKGQILYEDEERSKSLRLLEKGM